MEHFFQFVIFSNKCMNGLVWWEFFNYQVSYQLCAFLLSFCLLVKLYASSLRFQLCDVTIRNKHVFDQGKEKYGTAFLNLIERVGTTSIKEKRKKVVVGRRSSLSFQRNQRVEEERLKPQQPRSSSYRVFWTIPLTQENLMLDIWLNSLNAKQSYYLYFVFRLLIHLFLCEQ